MHVCVITIDLQKSRKLEDRAEIQLKIFKLLQMLNEKFKNDILANFTMTLGDEFQGVLKTPKQALDVFNIGKDALATKIYCGIGLGTITTAVSKNPSEMDGPAFHNSRNALEEAKREKTELVIKTGDRDLDKTVNVIMQLILHIKNRQTIKQKEVITYLEENPNITQAEIAKKFRISKQAVSKKLKLACWEKIKRATELVRELLERSC